MRVAPGQQLPRVVSVEIHLGCSAQATFPHRQQQRKIFIILFFLYLIFANSRVSLEIGML